MTAKTKPIQTVGDIIRGDFFRPWREQQAYFERLQRETDAVLEASAIPPDCCRVERLDNDELRLSTVSGAAAARIKQILPTLQRVLNSKGYFVRAVCVSVVRIAE